jgi:5-(carboxyamino)imidazole ribonucleotide synthase
VAAKARELAVKAVEAVEGVGVFGVELFELQNGDVLYNEQAPRPHNSGHYTIEGCVTSQFENHIRAVLGWPLGSTALVAPAVVMVNVLGDRQGNANPTAAREALGVENAHVHIYSKRDVRPGRKMGHVTVTGDTLVQAEDAARRAADLVRF